MRKLVTRTLVVVLTLPVVALGALVLLNLRDEAPRTEVLKLWDAPAPERSEAGRRSYLYLLGLAAGERRDPEKRGAELLPQLDDASIRAALDSVDWGRPNFEGCDGGACGVADLTEERRQMLRATPTIGALYAGWMDFGDHAFLEPALAIPGPGAHLLYTLRLAEWLDQGGEARVWHSLANANQFYSKVLRTGPLGARLIAVANLTANARFVRKELIRRPAVAVPGDVLDSWRLIDPSEVISGAVFNEVRRLRGVLAQLGAGPGRVGLRPFETVNRVYDLFTQSAFTDCARPDRACVPALGYVGWASPVHWVINPRGRVLVAEAARALTERPRVERDIAEILALKAELRRRP